MGTAIGAGKISSKVCLCPTAVAALVAPDEGWSLPKSFERAWTGHMSGTCPVVRGTQVLVCWHVYMLLRESVRNPEDAANSAVHTQSRSILFVRKHR